VSTKEQGEAEKMKTKKPVGTGSLEIEEKLVEASNLVFIL